MAFREQISICFQISKSGSSKYFFKCPQFTKVHTVSFLLLLQLTVVIVVLCYKNPTLPGRGIRMRTTSSKIDVNPGINPQSQIEKCTENITYEIDTYSFFFILLTLPSSNTLHAITMTEMFSCQTSLQ